MTTRCWFGIFASALLGSLPWASLQTAEAASPDGTDATLGLPALHATDQRTDERIALGRKLFMDRRLSRNGTMSCGMCHVPEQGFTVNELATAVGIEGRSLRRNTPTVLNVGLSTSFFHDGRAETLEEQVWGPLLAADEMGNATRAEVIDRIGGFSDYASPFERAFPGRRLSPETVGAALAAYERSLESGGSRFDRWLFRGEAAALSEAERRGYGLFRGKARCSSCHEIGVQHALFTDNAFHNTGVGVARVDRSVAQIDVQLAPDVQTKVSARMLDELFGAPSRDEGRYEVTKVDKDRFAYRTPTLRNVELTAPYMHDGSLATLREVVDFYDHGGNPNPRLDQLIVPLFLSEHEKDDLVAFLRTLTGSNVGRLAAQARAAASSPSFR
jgi:cytochrome c peroxidase